MFTSKLGYLLLNATVNLFRLKILLVWIKEISKGVLYMPGIIRHFILSNLKFNVELAFISLWRTYIDRFILTLLKKKTSSLIISLFSTFLLSRNNYFLLSERKNSYVKYNVDITYIILLICTFHKYETTIETIYKLCFTECALIDFPNEQC